MKTLIIRTSTGWELRIKQDTRLIRSWSFNRLIEAIDMASMLQLHVNNISALPLSQYALYNDTIAL